MKRTAKRHQSKLLAARRFRALLTGSPGVIDIDAFFSEDHEYGAEWDHGTRLASMYVDIDEGQVVGGPTEVTEIDARYQWDFAYEVLHLSARKPPTTSSGCERT